LHLTVDRQGGAIELDGDLSSGLARVEKRSKSINSAAVQRFAWEFDILICMLPD
jgi:hypothetical protein